MPTPAEHLNRNVRYLAKEQGLELVNVARQLAISLAELEAWLRDQAWPTPTQLVQLAEHLHISLDLLLREDLTQLPVAQAKGIKLVVWDVDGTLTDGGLYFSETGHQHKRFNVKDGPAIKALGRMGIETGFLSASTCIDILKPRANGLGVRYVHAHPSAKWPVLEKWMDELQIAPKEVAFCGDDLTDIPVLTRVGLGTCPADAVPAVRRAAHHVLQSRGGEGCARELVERFFMPLLED